MNAISQLNHPNNEPLNAWRMTSAAVSSRQSLDVAITTAEGDQVTLNSTAGITAAYATYEGSVSAQASSVARTNGLFLSVQGDLNKAETKDISKAIHTCGKVVKDVLSGRLQPAEAHTRQLARLDEISHFSATFTSQQALSVETQSIIA